MRTDALRRVYAYRLWRCVYLTSFLTSSIDFGALLIVNVSRLVIAFVVRSTASIRKISRLICIVMVRQMVCASVWVGGCYPTSLARSLLISL